MSFLRRVCAWPIRAYQRWISPLKPPTCRYQPTCSAYAHEAILVHGVFKGMLLAGWRILRCQPLCKEGLDPVPEPGHWRPEAGVRARHAPKESEGS